MTADPDRAEETRELTDLLYALTHDLGAPLRVIDGFSEALLEEQQDALPPDALEYLTTIRGAVSRMNGMFEGIMQLYRVSQAPLRRIDVDVTALAGSILSELRAAEPARDVQSAVERDLVAKADPALFRTALAHLLQNAWKFTAKRNGAVIAVGREEPATLFVRDNGAGFDPAAAGRMFIPFQRFHSASEYEGLGIGLAVVRRIVQRHGGRVRAAGALQQGTTIYMELP
ncbi:MAG TPA: ATP-binding protein [Thermoanaerobaculia bacterium]|nr:ATP-binding protein [Thermoanaerobaculia bacterium]